MQPTYDFIIENPTDKERTGFVLSAIDQKAANDWVKAFNTVQEASTAQSDSDGGRRRLPQRLSALRRRESTLQRHC